MMDHTRLGGVSVAGGGNYVQATMSQRRSASNSVEQRSPSYPRRYEQALHQLLSVNPQTDIAQRKPAFIDERSRQGPNHENKEMSQPSIYRPRAYNQPSLRGIVPEIQQLFYETELLNRSQIGGEGSS
jgi:hypothetical protein